MYRIGSAGLGSVAAGLCGLRLHRIAVYLISAGLGSVAAGRCGCFVSGLLLLQVTVGVSGLSIGSLVSIERNSGPPVVVTVSFSSAGPCSCVAAMGTFGLFLWYKGQ